MVLSGSEPERGHQEDDDRGRRSGAPRPSSPGSVAAQMMRITRKPENTSVSGLVSEENRWVRITCFRYRSVWVLEPGRLALFLPVGADQPDGADPLRHGGGDSPAPCCGPVRGAEPSDQPLEQHDQERDEGEGEEGEPQRDLAEERPA